MKTVEGSKLAVGQKVYIIDNNLQIIEKTVLAIIVKEEDFSYKLDEYSCGGTERKQIFIKKSEAEKEIQDFMDTLKFKIGDLVIFKDVSYSRNEICIGRIYKIYFSKDSPYSIESSFKQHSNENDKSIMLKVKNDFIENFGDLRGLYGEWEIKDKELREITRKINDGYDKLEKELKYSFKKCYNWGFFRKKPEFQDRFSKGISEENLK